MKIKAPFVIRAAEPELSQLLGWRWVLFGYGVTRRIFLKFGVQVPADAVSIDRKNVRRIAYRWGYRAVQILPDPSHGSSGDPRA